MSSLRLRLQYKTTLIATSTTTLVTPAHITNPNMTTTAAMMNIVSVEQYMYSKTINCVTLTMRTLVFLSVHEFVNFEKIEFCLAYALFY